MPQVDGNDEYPMYLSLSLCLNSPPEHVLLRSSVDRDREGNG